MKFIKILFICLIPATGCNHDTIEQQPTHVESTIQDTSIYKHVFDYTSILSKFPVKTTLNIDQQQLQKSRYTKYHPDRNLNNFYFELDELKGNDLNIIKLENKKKYRAFFYGQKQIDSTSFVVILLNDTTSTEINDSYVIQVLNKNNILQQSFELASIHAPSVEESTETTSFFEGKNVIKKQIYELYNTPVDEEPLKRSEKTDTIKLL